MDGLLYMLTPDVCLFFALFYAKFKKVWIKKQKKRLSRKKEVSQAPSEKKATLVPPSHSLSLILACKQKTCKFTANYSFAFFHRKMTRSPNLTDISLAKGIQKRIPLKKKENNLQRIFYFSLMIIVE